MFKGTVALVNSVNNTHSSVSNILALEQSPSEKPDVLHKIRTQREARTNYGENTNVENLNQIENYKKTFYATQNDTNDPVVDEVFIICNKNLTDEDFEFIGLFRKNLEPCPKKDDTTQIALENGYLTSSNSSLFYFKWFLEVNEILKSCDNVTYLVQDFKTMTENYITQAEGILEKCEEQEKSQHYRNPRVEIINDILSSFKNGSYSEHHCIKSKNGGSSIQKLIYDNRMDILKLKKIMFMLLLIKLHTQL